MECGLGVNLPVSVSQTWLYVSNLKVTGYLELYDFIYVYIYATKTGILKS